ncbi:GroES-like protein [Purpureocillium lavendulum]|uniref:GroES-like protein n=1 Tax=Purpureocillium lavendulum TaxID=1247861 RepID=A0AB34FIH6_9HYPO|nr:GroES-like protein [Purpureocillium lavendulum]
MNLKTVLLGALAIGLAAARPPSPNAAQAHYRYFPDIGGIANKAKALGERSIDLTKPFVEYKIPTTLYEKVGPYTFAFDSTNRRLFFSVPENPQQPLGYNCLICFDLAKPAGSYEKMFLYGFGPGNVSFAALPEGNDTRLWFDVDPDASGHAQGLAAFLWRRDDKLYNPSTGLIKAAPIKGATDYAPTYDAATQSLVFRYQLNNKTRMAAYDAVSAAKKDFSKPKYDIQVPALRTASKTVRGYAVLGQNLYVMTGDSVSGALADAKTEIANINIQTLKVTQGPVLAQIKTTGGLYEAMPQGLGLDYKKGDHHQLMIGVAGRSPYNRQANMYSNNALLA